MYVNTIGCIGSGRSRSTSSSSLSPVTSLSRSRTSPSFSRSSSQTLSGPEPIIGDKNRQKNTYIHTCIHTYIYTLKWNYWFSQIFLESRCHLGYDFEWCKKSELLLWIYICISIYVRMYVWMYVWRWIRSGSFRSCLRMWMCARNVKWRMPSSPCCSCPADPSTDKVDLTYSPSMYVCTHLCMYECMYVWFLHCRLQIHEERLGRKRKRSEFCGIITMYVYIYVYTICI